MLRLHLLRHAKTEISSPTGEDFDRELMIKGIIQANMTGLFFQINAIEPKKILCSSAKRTVQTLDIVRHSFPVAPVHLDAKLYLADRESLLEQIWKQKNSNDMLLIGHNEGISNLASYLSGEDINLKTCAYVCVSFPFEHWNEISHGTGTIDLKYRPLAHFP
jgi:phosphohistidine phosphatase